MSKVNINCNKNNYCKLYLLLWQGTLNLTPTETETLSLLLTHYLNLAKEVKEPYLSTLLFSTQSRKEMQEELDFSPQRFNNYIKYLKQKGALQEDGESYRINPKLIPRKEISFEFVVED